MTSRILILLLALALPAQADMVGPMLAADLNGDGRAERFALIDTGDGSVDLQIENTGLGNGVIYAERIAWIGGIGQRPELELAPNGSLRLISMNEAIGRDRWRMTLTIAYRRDTYLVAGFEFAWYDTLDNDNNGVCDLNLLTGRGYLSINGGPDKPLRTDQPALPVTRWNDDTPIPTVCDVRN